MNMECPNAERGGGIQAFLSVPVEMGLRRRRCAGLLHMHVGSKLVHEAPEPGPKPQLTHTRPCRLHLEAFRT